VTAVIRWKSPEAGGRKSPPGPHYRTVVHFASDPRWPQEAWTLTVTPRWLSPGGEVMVADVKLLADTAPHHFLVPGAKFELLEGTRSVAAGVVMLSEGTLNEIEQLAEAI